MGLFGGSNSSAQGNNQAAMNSSGWSVKGKASGGGLSASGGAGLPWYAWLSIGAVCLAFFRKRGS